jgi:hypothetical protein
MTPDQWQAEAAMVVVALAGIEEPRAFELKGTGAHINPYCVLCNEEARTTAGPIHHAADCPWRVARELATDPDHTPRT